jgi:hypothetical protein
MKQWKSEDPSARPQQALPSSTVRVIAETYRASQKPHNHTVGDLVVTTYFFLLRVGEYTSTRPRRGRRKLTIPLHKRDITFWKEGRCVPHNSPLDALTMADMVTVNLGNQKNGRKDAKMNHARSGDDAFDPVSSLARLVHTLAGLPDDSPLGTFREGTRLRQVTSQDILQAVRHGAIVDRLQLSGYDVARIGTHSLRSGGATRLCQEGYNGEIICLMGRWSPDTYMRYIQPQIAQLTAGVLARMATPRCYKRVDQSPPV